MGAARILVGTSGYAYPHWRDVLYPRRRPSARWLARYADVFPTVELNATFYRLPSESAVEGWRGGTPPGFVFACKGSRYLTHMKRLTDAGEGVERFFSRVGRLREKLGVVLWQLPPQMARLDLGRLAAFLEALPRSVRHAFEFRDEAWYDERVCRLLDAHGMAFCEHDLVERVAPCRRGGFRYLRFHGRGARYAGRYGRRALARIAADLEAWRRSGGAAFVYFNNDALGHAVRDARELNSLIRGAGSLAPLDKRP